MKITPFLCLLFMVSCHAPEIDDGVLSQGELSKELSPKKQKQKISFLQKKLEIAKAFEKKAQAQVERLRAQIEQSELALVRKSIRITEDLLFKLEDDPYGVAKRAQIDVSMLFLQEREILHRLIESGPSPAALEAQVLLDQVLRIITHLSDETIQL